MSDIEPSWVERIREGMMSPAQVWEIAHGRKPTPEELENSRKRSLMVLDSIQMSLSSSDQMWEGLDSQ